MVLIANFSQLDQIQIVMSNAQCRDKVIFVNIRMLRLLISIKNRVFKIHYFTFAKVKRSVTEIVVQLNDVFGLFRCVLL